jgi:hemoglobin
VPLTGAALAFRKTPLTCKIESAISEQTESLFERIGGQTAITGLVDDFYRRVCDDPDLAPFFEHASMEKLVRMQNEFFCAALGGPIEYSGPDLAHAHHGRGIGRIQFGQFVEHLLGTLQSRGISDQDAKDIIQSINTYEEEITSDASEDG